MSVVATNTVMTLQQNKVSRACKFSQNFQNIIPVIITYSRLSFSKECSLPLFILQDKGTVLYNSVMKFVLLIGRKGKRFMWAFNYNITRANIKCHDQYYSKFCKSTVTVQLFLARTYCLNNASKCPFLALIKNEILGS